MNILFKKGKEKILLEDICTELKNRRNKINNFKGERKAIDNI